MSLMRSPDCNHKNTMTPHFVKLPSGNIINANLVCWIGPFDTGVRYQLANDGHEDFNTERDISLADFLALLQPQSPLISPIPTPGSLNYGKPFSFSYEGRPLHGVIDGYGMRPDTSFYIRICADGEYYLCKLGTNLVVKDQ